MATTNLASVVATLRNQGASDCQTETLRSRPLTGAFQLGITGSPGVYTVLGSTDLAVWDDVGVATNFTDVSAHLSPRKFYSVR